MKMRIEKDIKDTILEKPIEIELGGRTFVVTRPTVATMISISEYTAELPTVETKDDNVKTALALGEHSHIIANVLAILILGERKYILSFLNWRYWIDKWKFKKMVTFISNQDIEEVNNALMETIGLHKLGFFLGIITFLNDINLMKKTKTT